jgi:hypothetical protein
MMTRARSVVPVDVTGCTFQNCQVRPPLTSGNSLPPYSLGRPTTTGDQVDKLTKFVLAISETTKNTMTTEGICQEKS